MRPSRKIPLLRGFVGATVATFVALASHVWTGGAMPGMLGIAVPWLLSLTVCTLLAGRRLSLLRLSVSVLLSQLLFHALFVLGSITPTGVLTPHVHGLAGGFGPGGFEPGALGPGTAVLVPQGAGMWFGHLAAGVLTIVLLHRGELIVRALLAAASAVSAWLRRILLVPTRAQRPASRRWTVLVAPIIRRARLDAMRRRGPPRLV
ncbi:hypothetical protein [Microbacterium suwonense]|uniref:Integral membrane protein n=1 Tax=Microbacterium suwonense TaxID=683047 RepID=A0ABM8FX37_9MICO|nr:hypothetical protein [Microbacterium suwonense]BDZ40119.1 hypothetical protein GCM10025863_27330 [Microbacterium suwonense]